MAPGKKSLPLVPPPFSFGIVYANRIFDTEFQNSEPSVVAQHLSSIVRSTDFHITISILSMLFTKTEEESNAERKNKIVSIIKEFIFTIQEDSRFRPTVITFFNKMQTFPSNIFDVLDLEVALTLLIYATGSKFEEESKKYIEEKIVPNKVKINTKQITDDIFYELYNLNFPEFDPNNFNNHPESITFSIYEPDPETVSANIEPRVQGYHSVPIQSVFAESNIALITNKNRLSDLFNFYPDFNENHAAAFVLAIVTPHLPFKCFIENLTPKKRQKLFASFKALLLEKKVSFTKLIDCLDMPNVLPLQRDSNILLFTILRTFLDKEPIPLDSFTKQWNNSKLQLSLFMYFTQNAVEGLDFGKTKTQFDLHGFLPEKPVLNDANRCWSSQEFIQRSVILLGNDSNLAEKFFDPISPFPGLEIALFSQPSLELTEPVLSVARSALVRLLQQTEGKEIGNRLWSTSSNFLRSLIIDVNKANPQLLEKIYSVFSDHISTLIDEDDARFATDIAIMAASEEKLDITQFISNYSKKHNGISLQLIVSFVAREAPTYNSGLLNISNSIFNFLHENFQTFSLSQQIFIDGAYTAAAELQPGLHPQQFDVKIPQKLANETKAKAGQCFNDLMSGNLTSEKFEKDLRRCFFDDPLLFNSIFGRILSEMEHIQDTYKIPTLKMLAGVVSQLIVDDVLYERQYQQLLSAVKSGLTNEQQSLSYVFAASVLTGLLPVVKQFPQFVFDVMRETRLRENSPELFDSVQKIGQLLNEPLNNDLPTTVTMHPKLRRFNNMETPAPKLARELLKLQKDPSILAETLKNFPGSEDWAARVIVESIQDTPKNTEAFVEVIIGNGSFWNNIVQAACAASIGHITSSDITTHHGCLRRRRLIVLGNFIGLITLNINRPLLSRFLDLKKLVLYAASQGVMYSVVPFVCSILMNASPFFNPPNPYMSSVLNVLAGVYKMDSIKMLIKQVIAGLFAKKNVSLSMFASPPSYFPSLTEGNFDYLITPFSLNRSLSGNDVEKLTNFDETLYAQFVQELIILPENPNVKHSSREKMRQAIIQHSLHHIRMEGTSLSNTAASTAIELIKKDFKFAPAETVKEQAYELTRQLASSLTLFTAPMKMSRPLLQAFRQADPTVDQDWAESVASMNYEWISQLLRDIVRVKAWKMVQEKLKEKSNNISILPVGLRQSSAAQAVQIYSDLFELSLSQQAFPDWEIITGHEKMISIDNEFDTYLASFRKLVSFDTPYDTPLDDAAIATRVAQCPNFSITPIDFNRFRSIVKTVLLWASKNPTHQFESVICQVLERVVTSTPPILLKHIRRYVLTWVRSTLSPFVICELVRLKLMKEEDLDKAYTELLNAEPFNSRVLLQIASTLSFGLVENTLLRPQKFISTLTFISMIRPEQLPSEAIFGRYAQIHKELTAVFEVVYAPESEIPERTKLQKLGTFDATEEIAGQVKSLNAVSRWRAAYNEMDGNDDTLMEEMREVIQHGSPAISALFATESEEACSYFMSCFKRTTGFSSSVSDVIEAVVKDVVGNGTVIGFDMRKYYEIFRATIEIATTKAHYETIARALHSMRPVIAPSFTFGWIQLVSDPSIAGVLLSNEEYWVSYFVLLADFAYAVGSIDRKIAPDVFNRTYRGLLRLILIIEHDYRSFLSSAAPLLVEVIPFEFAQLRNILLSQEPDANTIFARAALQLSPPPKFLPILKQIESAKEINRSIVGQAVAQFTEKDAPDSMIYSFINAVLAKTAGMRASDTVEESVAYCALDAVFDTAPSEIAYKVVAALVDRVRGDSKESIAAGRMLTCLLKSKHTLLHGYTVSEIAMRVAAERISAAAPTPEALSTLFRDLIAEDQRTNIFSSMPYVMNNPQVFAFLKSKATK